MTKKLQWLYKISRPRNLLRLTVWVLCTSLLVFFFKGVFNDYIEQSPISTVTYVNQKHFSSPINVKVCNEVYLDKRKVLNYNGSQLSFDSYRFLYEAMSGNDDFNDSRRIFVDKNSVKFFVSFKTLETFKLDVEDFLVGCLTSTEAQNCTSSFKLFPEFNTICYDATINVSHFDKNNGIFLVFYFNPNMTMGKYTTTIGAFVTVAHEGQYIAPAEGFYLNANEMAVVSGSVVHLKQEADLTTVNCVEKDVETYHFTGEPFETLYHPETCMDICYAQFLWLLCKCSPITGWNLTKTECLEDPENMNCLWTKGYQNKTEFLEYLEDCSSKCWPKCNQKILQTSVLKKSLNWNGYHLREYLSRLDKSLGEKKSQRKLLQINESNSEEWDKVAPHVSKVFIRLKTEPVKIVKVVPLVNFTTFMSNFGGILGMCLGLSAISVFELMEKFIYGAILSGTRKQSDNDYHD